MDTETFVHEAANIDSDNIHDREAPDLNDLLIESWLRQVTGGSGMSIEAMTRAMLNDGFVECEARMLAALGMLRYSATPLTQALHSDDLQEGIWALLRFFTQARREAILNRVASEDKVRSLPLASNRLPNNLIDIDELPISVRMSCQSPDLILFDNVLSPQECEALIAMARDGMTISKVMGGEGDVISTEHRSSYGTFLDPGSSSTLTTIESRIANLVGWPLDQTENLAVTRYFPGQEFKAHVDFFDDVNKPSHRDTIAAGGQRVGTVILYLSDVTTGGHTVFDFRTFEIRPKKCSALYFSYQSADGSMDVTSLHSGSPVIDGEKWIATLWLRERPVRSLSAQNAGDCG